MSLTNCILVFAVGLIIIVQIQAQKSEKQLIQSYQTCRTDRDCKENSFCFGNDDEIPGKCKCLAGFELFRNTTFYECRKGVKPGEACENDFDCMITATESRCNKYNLCECKSQTVEYNGNCYLKVKLGEVCMTNENCHLDDGTVNGTFGLCVLGRCRCRTNQVPSEDKTRCYDIRKLSEKCSFDEECQLNTTNTKCSEICACANTFTLSRNGTACVKAATKFGEQCDFDGQCSAILSQSVCNDGKCGCTRGHHEYYLQCALTKRIGEKCEQDAQCLYNTTLYDNVKCENGICKCLSGYKEDGSCMLTKTFDNNRSTSSIGDLYILILSVYCIDFIRNFYN